MLHYHIRPHRSGSGSAMLEIDVEILGHPYGAIWKRHSTPETVDKWHAKPLAGEHRAFDSLREAKDYVEGPA